MLIAIFAALGAAICWSCSSLFSVYPSNYLGAICYNRYRSIIVSIILAIIVTILGGWATIQGGYMMFLLLIGGIVGVFLGDTALFMTLRRMGPRRTAILFAMNAPIVTFLGFFFLDEKLNINAAIGCSVILSGVILAIIYGKRKSQSHHWEEVKGKLWVGIAFGILTASAQAVGIIITKPVLDAGADPIAVSAVRVGIAAVALILVAAIPNKNLKPINPPNKKSLLFVTISGMLGMGIGMTLLLYALANGDAGIVATLAATSPVMMLPLLWIKTKERPAAGAWLGAALVVAGTGIIFNG